MDPVPDSRADKTAQRKARARAYADGCAERSGWMLPHADDMNTARDLDVIRAALGEKKLNYLGVSPTAPTSAPSTAPLPGHPPHGRGRRGQPLAGEIWYQASLDQDVAFEGPLEKDWQDWVAANDAAFHLGTTRAAVQAKWLKLRATAKKHPIGGVVGPAELISFFQSAPYHDSSWVPVATVFSKYVAGDTQALVDAAAPDLSDTAGNISAENGNAVSPPSRCADAKWPTSWQRWDRDNTRLHRDYPLPDLGQRLDEPAVRHLAGQAAHPGRRQDPQEACQRS